MTTTTPTKKIVETTWNVKQIQETAAAMAANMCASAQKVLSKPGNEALKAEYETLVRAGKVQHYKALGVKTPIELVKAMAETETNVFGSQIEITGDEKSASMNYVACAMWNAIEKVQGKMTPEQEEKAGVNFQNCVMELGKEFGFKGEVKFEEPCCTVTFTK